ncbi:MAG: tetratricopeptide repeat protein [Armatimonadota bacterium]|nr:tetratricopeptide repeat protein [Armatimonadota bacterium]MCX7778106.1 tetratricopeptide repeat protein [Armatimonadota bacterium]MDW8026167.1 tetratricopeptide repeat protein [Armatimonadota bacterium]
MSAQEDKIEELLDLADAARIDGKYDEAVQLYERVLESDPNSLRAHIGLGLIYSFGYKGMFMEACHELEKAIQLSPNEPQLWVWLGKAYQQVAWLEDDREMLLKSKWAFERALEIDPNNEEAIKQLRYLKEFGL